MMGAPQGEQGRYFDERHNLRKIEKSFWISIHEVTQKSYKDIVGKNPSYFKTSDDIPVENISWNDAIKFCELLTEKEQITGRISQDYYFRLPYEQEWEYVCRAGTQTPFSFGNNLNFRMANFNGYYPYGKQRKGIFRGKTVKVGSFKPNYWGLYDMHGNVWEWCMDSDISKSLLYKSSKDVNLFRCVKGGSWFSYGKLCRSACRVASHKDKAFNYVGFRIVLSKK